MFIPMFPAFTLRLNSRADLPLVVKMLAMFPNLVLLLMNSIAASRLSSWMVLATGPKISCFAELHVGGDRVEDGRPEVVALGKFCDRTFCDRPRSGFAPSSTPCSMLLRILCFAFLDTTGPISVCSLIASPIRSWQVATLNFREYFVMRISHGDKVCSRKTPLPRVAEK